MFDVSGDVSLPAGMTLSIVSGLEANADLINCSGTLNASGTSWNINAKHPARWAVETKQNTIRALYTMPGTKLLVR